MNSNKVLALAWLAVLLTGCGGGGGGGSANVQSTANNAPISLAAVLYSRLDVPGVEQAHRDGWTGKGKSVTILEDDTFNPVNVGDDGHGRLVSDIVHVTAPGATRNEFHVRGLMNNAKNLITMSSDVITISVGYAPSQQRADPALASYIVDVTRDFESSDALVTVAAQHRNWTGVRSGVPVRGRGGFTTCPNDATITITVENCNTWAVKGLDSSNVIYVGEVDSSNNIPLWSNQAGDAHKNQFIVTSSGLITRDSNGEPNGNSFAAPRVAGAGALVRHKFPNLTGTQTAMVILHAADDLGATGVDSVYGYGKLNVGKALAPIGNLR